MQSPARVEELCRTNPFLAFKQALKDETTEMTKLILTYERPVINDRSARKLNKEVYFKTCLSAQSRKKLFVLVLLKFGLGQEEIDYNQFVPEKCKVKERPLTLPEYLRVVFDLKRDCRFEIDDFLNHCLKKFYHVNRTDKNAYFLVLFQTFWPYLDFRNSLQNTETIHSTLASFLTPTVGIGMLACQQAHPLEPDTILVHVMKCATRGDFNFINQLLRSDCSNDLKVAVVLHVFSRYRWPREEELLKMEYNYLVHHCVLEKCLTLLDSNPRQSTLLVKLIQKHGYDLAFNFADKDHTRKLLQDFVVANGL